jgi:hypothetical protein
MTFQYESLCNINHGGLCDCANILLDKNYKIDLTKKKGKLIKVTDIEKSAWQKSDNLAKAIEYLHKTDLKEATRRKMIRDIIKDNLIAFFEEYHKTA